jgi:cytochrome c biogenesis protein CcmG/thiol:disulfide interchange protein DsbE
MDTTSLPPDDRPPVTTPRRVNRGLLWASALAVVVLAIATVVAFTSGGGSTGGDIQSLDPNGTQPIDDSLTGDDVTGQALPAVSYKTFDGAEVPLSTGGKPLLINFWSSTCAPCIKEMPDLEQSYQANSGRLGFLGLQVSERAESGVQMIEKTGVTYPTGRDPSAAIFRAFGGVGLPRTVIVRTDGTIAYVHSGALTAAQLQQAIDENLGG